jgi:hypothetical protein
VRERLVMWGMRSLRFLRGAPAVPWRPVSLFAATGMPLRAPGAALTGEALLGSRHRDTS